MIRPTRSLAALLVLGACSRREVPPPPPEAGDSAPAPGKPPEARFQDGATVDFWQGDTLAWRLVSKDLRQEDRSERVWAKPVDLVAFGRDGKPSAHILADSGSMDRDMRYFRAWGHVVGTNHGGMELRTDSILFDKEADRIHTAARVRVRTEAGDVLTGRGFRSDAYLNRWEILSDVRGTLRDLNSFPFGGL